MYRRAFVGVVLAAVAALTFGGSATPAVAHQGSLTWLTTGDSYSSGEGVTEAPGLFTNLTRPQKCGQNSAAWGQAAQALLKDRWTIEKQAFSACTGRRTRDFYGRYEDQTSLWEWTKEQGLPAGNRFDVVTMSFGGNDISFGDVLLDCLPGSDPRKPENWSDLLDPRFDDCDVEESELISRVEGLAANFQFDAGPPSGFAQTSAGPMSAFYRAVLDRHVTPRGHIVVLGYPHLIAPKEEWSGWQLRCHGITRADAEMLGRVADKLDETLTAQAKAANRNTERVHFQSVVQTFRSGNHELCGKGDPWLNGQTTRDNLIGSFHPNASGYEAEAKVVAGLVRGLPWRLPADRAASSPSPVTDTGAPIPDAVMRKVTAIYEAARKKDHVGVGALSGPQFTYTFGRPATSPAAYWQAVAQRNVDPLASLVTVLESPPVLFMGEYHYPYFFDKPIGRWTDPDFEFATAVYPGEPLTGVAGHTRCAPDNNEIGCIWLGYRVTIKPDGTWTSFVAGD